MCGICLVVRIPKRKCCQANHLLENPSISPSPPLWEVKACEFSSRDYGGLSDLSSSVTNHHLEGDNDCKEHESGRTPHARSFYDRLNTAIRCRGPDRTGTIHRRQFENPGDDTPAYTLTGLASVLGLRGHSPVEQPYMVPNGNESFLMWNGEVFGGNLCPNPGESDTRSVAMRIALFEQETFSLQNYSLAERQMKFLKLVSSAMEEEIEGPYGFIYYSNLLSLVVFGRDPLGRRSLLIHVRESGKPPLSADKPSYAELSASKIDLAEELEVIISSVGIQHRDPNLDLTRDSERLLRNVQMGESKTCYCTSKKRTRELDNNAKSSDTASVDGLTATALSSSCWIEVPVTGIMGLALSDRCTSLSSTLEQHNNCNEVIPQSKVRCSTVCFHHCPWSKPHHLIHPLLRGPSCKLEFPLLEKSLSSLINEVKDLQFPSWCSPLLLNTLQKARETFFSSCEMSGNSERQDEESILVHHAALMYLLSLSASVYRRIHSSTTEAVPLCGGGDVPINTEGHRPIGILFSGGLDCTVLAALAHFLLPVDTPIELINVAFGKEPRLAPDRIATFRAMTELLRLPKAGKTHERREWRLVLIDVPDKVSPHTPHILNLLTPHNSVMDLDIGTALWHAAQGRGRMQRLLHGAELPSQNCLSEQEQFTKTTESTEEGQQILERSSKQPCDIVLPNHHKYYRLRNDHSEASSVPLVSDKFALLVQVLVTECRESGAGPHVPVLLSTLGKDYADILTPHFQRHGFRKLGSFLDAACRDGVIRFDPTAGKSSKAVLLARKSDIEVAAAVAARTRSEFSDWYRLPHIGEEQLEGFPPAGSLVTKYECESKVLLLGIGADETLGGYTRHRRLFLREGMDGAMRELQRDFSRLWERNLGRDDRIVMDSGREARLPYLDEGLLRTLQDLVAYYGAMTTEPKSDSRGNAEAINVNENMVEEKRTFQECVAPILTYTLGPGEGDKRVLRQVAHLLGLGNVSRLEKRAIQFGSRIAERKVPGTAILDH